MAKRYALFAVAIGFTLGALARSFVVFDVAVLGFVGLLAVVLTVAACATRVSRYALGALFLIACALGAGRAMLAPQSLPEPFLALIGAEASLEGVIVREPDVRETSQRIVLRAELDGEETNLLVVLPPYPPAAYGERIRVAGLLLVPEPFETTGGRSFQYDDYLAKDGIFSYMPRASAEPISEASGTSVALGALMAAKQEFIHGLENALPEPHAGLAAGILVGGKQGLGSELQEAFIAAGLVHIVVLSGYNVMIVASALSRATRRLGVRASNAIGAASILAFVLAAGAGSASVRAGLMAALALFARASGRTYDALRALAAVLLLMLLWNPLSLAFDVGLQFSLAATLGLILGTPFAERILAFVKSGFIREIAATTIAAQMGVLPILLYQTGMLSPYALVANMLALPAVPLAMLLSFAAALVGMLAPLAAPVFGLPAYAMLSYLSIVAESVARLPYADAVVPSFPFACAAAAYACLALFIARAQRAASARGYRTWKE